MFLYYIPTGNPILSEEVGDARIYRHSTTNNTNSNAFVKRNTTEAGTQITVKFCIQYICGNTTHTHLSLRKHTRKLYP
jgi:hypothetical protein